MFDYLVYFYEEIENSSLVVLSYRSTWEFVSILEKSLQIPACFCYFPSPAASFYISIIKWEEKANDQTWQTAIRKEVIRATKAPSYKNHLYPYVTRNVTQSLDQYLSKVF